MSKLWPQSLSGRMVLLLLLALGTAHAITFSVFVHERRSVTASVDRERFALRVVPVVRLLNETPLDLHRQIAHAASSTRVKFTLSEAALARATGADADARQRQLANLLEADPADVIIGAPGSDVAAFSIRLDDGQWVNVSHNLAPLHHQIAPPLISLALAALALTLVSVVMLRRITRPMTELVAAADALGRGEGGNPLAESGPEEIRRMIRAFNRMSDRLHRFVRDRTRMLAAISHDLRTPITSLRLRAEFIEEEENRLRILATLDEMQRMTEAVLAFAREDSTHEETRSVDLAALVQSICDDMSDRGQDVAFTGPARLAHACRPIGLKRALRNLIENAVIYGARARVDLLEEGDTALIRIDDDGPGIPPAEVERVFEPFVRLEDSRNAETGGIGLGMSIARTIVRAHGGDVSIANREGGGLRCSITLPMR